MLTQAEGTFELKALDASGNILLELVLKSTKISPQLREKFGGSISIRFHITAVSSK